MTRYRKRPITVDAFQMTEAAMNDPTDWPEWLLDARYKVSVSAPGSLRPRTNADGRIADYDIFTLEGPHIVIPDAWIIRGVKGEIWAVRDDIFRETYEEVH